MVEFFGVTFLPASKEWFSGIISYPILLVFQIVIILLMAQVATDIIAQKYFRKTGVPQTNEKGELIIDENGNEFQQRVSGAVRLERLRSWHVSRSHRERFACHSLRTGTSYRRDRVFVNARLYPKGRTWHALQRACIRIRTPWHRSSTDRSDCMLRRSGRIGSPRHPAPNNLSHVLSNT